MDFTNRIVMVTGAAGNLGSAVARAFAEKGATLVLMDLSREALAKVHGEGEGSLLVPVDLRDRAGVGAAVREVLDRFGRIDALCNIAGGFRMGEAVHEMSPATWDFLMDINAGTLLSTVHAVVPHMLERGQGKIVNVGAAAAQKGMARMGAYCAAKSAVIRLTESMAAELREHGVNVNCVLPSILDTPENRSAMPNADPARWVSPDDLASVVLFLSSDAARAVHGAAIPVTGLS